MTQRDAVAIPRQPLSQGALAVTRHLLIHGPSTRAALGQRLALSDSSVSRLARGLVDEGMIFQNAELEQAVGRPRQILTAARDARHVVGVKLTHDTAYAVACDMYGTVLHSAETPVPARDNEGTVPPRATAVTVGRLVRRLARRLPALDAVGVSLGGPVTDHRTVLTAPFLGWHNTDVAELLQSEIPAPITISNDVAAFTREQLWFGAGRTHSTFAVITVGAGLGFGLVREGHVLEGLLDGGHILAHSPVDLGRRRCSLGHRGCAAAYLNRDDIERYASAKLGRPLTTADLVAGRDHGDAVMTEILDDAARALGHLVATFAGALQTDRVVLAGEEIEHLTAPGSPMHTVITRRLDPGPDAVLRAELEITTESIDFWDWARGAAVVAVQDMLGGLQ